LMADCALQLNIVNNVKSAVNSDNLLINKVGNRTFFTYFYFISD